MLEQAFNEVYTKFKLHFYRSVFGRFQKREASLTTVETFCMEIIMALGKPTVNEPFFTGHFPQYRVMPGVLIIEALAQVGAVAILSLPENKGKLAFFGGIKNARFKKQVRPGDVLELSCELIERRGPIGFGKAVAKVDGKVAAQGELTFAVGG